MISNQNFEISFLFRNFTKFEKFGFAVDITPTALVLTFILPFYDYPTPGNTEKRIKID